MKKKQLIGILFYAALIFGTYILQAMIFPRLRLWDTAPLLFPMIAVGTGLFGGKTRGCAVGFFCGAFYDLCCSETIVTFMLFLAAAGLCAGYLGETVLARGFPSFVCCSLGALVLSAALSALPFVLFKGASISEVLPTAAYQTLYSAFFILPLYYPVRFVCLY